jgi:DNA-binding transcriptional ArsR family regulator
MQLFDKSPVPWEGLADLAFLARALADENRLRIIIHVSQGKRSVSQIAEDLSMSQPLVSHHLRELKRALLVQVERRGPFIFYSLSRPEVVEVIASIKELAATLIGERKSF